mgnify:CR=1 FL=1
MTALLSFAVVLAQVVVMKITSFKIYTCAGMTSTVMVLVIFFSTNFMGANSFSNLFSVVHSVYNAFRMGATYAFGAYIAILRYLMLIKGLFIVVGIFVYIGMYPYKASMLNYLDYPVIRDLP